MRSSTCAYTVPTRCAAGAQATKHLHSTSTYNQARESWQDTCRPPALRGPRTACNQARQRGSQAKRQGAHRLDLVLALDQQVQQLLRVHGGLAEVGHQPDQRLRRTAALRPDIPRALEQTLAPEAKSGRHNSNPLDPPAASRLADRFHNQASLLDILQFCSQLQVACNVC